MLKQERRWKEVAAKLEEQDDKLEIVLNNTTGNQMISQTDFRGLNFDDVLGKWLVSIFFSVFKTKMQPSTLYCYLYHLDRTSSRTNDIVFFLSCVNACIDSLQN